MTTEKRLVYCVCVCGSVRICLSDDQFAFVYLCANVCKRWTDHKDRSNRKRCRDLQTETEDPPPHTHTRTQTHTRTHARTHTHTRAHTHTHTHTHTQRHTRTAFSPASRRACTRLCAERVVRTHGLGRTRPCAAPGAMNDACIAHRMLSRTS